MVAAIEYYHLGSLLQDINRRFALSHLIPVLPLQGPLLPSFGTPVHSPPSPYLIKDVVVVAIVAAFNMH